jgi:hypothetical protein
MLYDHRDFLASSGRFLEDLVSGVQRSEFFANLTPSTQETLNVFRLLVA